MTVIRHFYFDKAKYRVADDEGNELLLEVDYKNGKFRRRENRIINRDTMKGLKDCAEQVAKGLITRKRNVNFSANIKT